MQFSLSAFQAWQRCEARYYYAYVRRLRPFVKDVAPKRGEVLHEYLAAYYTSIRDGKPALDAHAAGLNKLRSYEAELNGLANTALFAGNDKQAGEYRVLLEQCIDIADRYFQTRGKGDAERFEVLVVEQFYKLEIVTGITSVSAIDLVLRERDRGITWMVEHKSTTSVPDNRVRLRDLQTLLYTFVLERYGIETDGVLWNYLSTKPPDEPMLLASGKGLSKAKSIDTTYDRYLAAIQQNGLVVSDYLDVLERLAHREEDRFFPRFDMVIVARPAIMLDDYVTEAQRARQAELLWKHSQTTPVRSLSRDCSFCPYYRVCEAVITGGDEEEAIRLNFKEGKRESSQPG